MKIRIRHIALIFTLLLLGGIANDTRAAKVTYHILTLPIDHTKGTKNTKSEYDGKRMEAVRTIVDNANTVELPADFKSPLAKNFRYYPSSFVTNHGASAIYQNHGTKYFLYTAPGSPYRKVTVSNSGTVKAVTDSDEAAYTAAGSSLTATSETDFDTQIDALTEDGNYIYKIGLEEGDAVTADCDIYVTYEYDDTKAIKLDGSESYNIIINNRFLAFNRGRNNRLACIPTTKVSGEQLVSDDFVKVDVSGTGIGTYWNDATQNKNPRSKTESQFHFLFKYIGEDPYNVTIITAYDKDEYYIELYGSCDTKYVNKYY